MKMFTVKEYAKRSNITERAARKYLDHKVKIGKMQRKRGTRSYMYYDARPTPTYNWHDPFNKTRRSKQCNTSGNFSASNAGSATP